MAIANVHIDELSKRVLDEVDEDYFLIPQTTNLVADQREYPLGDDVMGRIKYVEAKLDGTYWLKLSEMELGQYEQPTDEDNIVANFENLEGECFYTMMRRGIYLFSGSVTAVTSGLKLWVYTYPAHLTDMASTDDMAEDPSTTTHGFPRQLHKALCDLIVIDYKSSSDIPIQTTEHEQNIEYHIKVALTQMKNQNSNRTRVGSLPEESDRGDEGYNF